MRAVGAVAGTTALAPVVARAQAPPAGKPAEPASTITSPPRDFSPSAPPATFVDPDVITIDAAFNRLRQGNTSIKRLWTGAHLCVGGPKRNRLFMAGQDRMRACEQISAR